MINLFNEDIFIALSNLIVIDYTQKKTLNVHYDAHHSIISVIINYDIKLEEKIFKKKQKQITL